MGHTVIKGEEVENTEKSVDEYDHLEEYAIDEAYSMASLIRGY